MSASGAFIFLVNIRINDTIQRVRNISAGHCRDKNKDNFLGIGMPVCFKKYRGYGKGQGKKRMANHHRIAYEM
jgi:hypothetical protein